MKLQFPRTSTSFETIAKYYNNVTESKQFFSKVDRQNPEAKHLKHWEHTGAKYKMCLILQPKIFIGILTKICHTLQ